VRRVAREVANLRGVTSGLFPACRDVRLLHAMISPPFNPRNTEKFLRLVQFLDRTARAGYIESTPRRVGSACAAFVSARQEPAVRLDFRSFQRLENQFRRFCGDRYAAALAALVRVLSHLEPHPVRLHEHISGA